MYERQRSPYVGNEPKVNNVCFCFPLPFFPLPVLLFSCAGPEAASAGGVLPSFAASQAVADGVVVPRIFFRDWFPPTAALGTRADDEDGSSGKADLDMMGGTGPLLERVVGPGTDIGPRITLA